MCLNLEFKQKFTWNILFFIESLFSLLIGIRVFLNRPEFKRNFTWNFIFFIESLFSLLIRKRRLFQPAKVSIIQPQLACTLDQEVRFESTSQCCWYRKKSTTPASYNNTWASYSRCADNNLKATSMAKRSVALPFSRLLLNQAVKNPMDAMFHGFSPSTRSLNLSLLGTPFCSSSSSRAVEHLLAQLEMEKHLKLMESVANFPPSISISFLLFCCQAFCFFPSCFFGYFLEWKIWCTLVIFWSSIHFRCLIHSWSLLEIYWK